MPGPPPPPPPAALPPMCPPPPAFNLAPSKGDSHGALLQSIRKGTNLKKAVTNDRSAPVVGGSKASTPSNNTNNSRNSNNNSSNSMPPTISNGVGLGGLFAGGMPKLKPVGKQPGGVYNSNGNSNYNNSDVSKSKYSERTRSHSNLQRNFSCAPNDVQSELKKQMASNSNRNRGPPPPAPTRNISQSNEHLQNSLKQSFYSRNGISSDLQLNISTLHRPSSSPHQSPTLPSPVFSLPHSNSSTLHRKANSSANLTTTATFDIIDDMNNGLSAPPSMRKPNVAPKPPPVNGKPATPPKKVARPSSLHRAQSMKSPRTPSPQTPEEYNYNSKFGTMRNMPSMSDKSFAPKTKPSVNTRPTAPPPLVPPQQIAFPHIPNKVNIVKPPSHAPPPPPNVAPQPPPHAPPPPPPQRGHYQLPVRTPPAVPIASAPAPPPRFSSIRDPNGPGYRMPLDLDFKFRNDFHSTNEFPVPGSYKALTKYYPNPESAC